MGEGRDEWGLGGARCGAGAQGLGGGHMGGCAWEPQRGSVRVAARAVGDMRACLAGRIGAQVHMLDGLLHAGLQV